jgi:hypothetical protein
LSPTVIVRCPLNRRNAVQDPMARSRQVSHRLSRKLVSIEVAAWIAYDHSDGT